MVLPWRYCTYIRATSILSGSVSYEMVITCFETFCSLMFLLIPVGLEGASFFFKINTWFPFVKKALVFPAESEVNSNPNGDSSSSR